MTTVLLIIFKHNIKKNISGVQSWGISPENQNMFFYMKHGKMTYIPISEVIYFGPLDNYKENVDETT